MDCHEDPTTGKESKHVGTEEGNQAYHYSKFYFNERILQILPRSFTYIKMLTLLALQQL